MSRLVVEFVQEASLGRAVSGSNLSRFSPAEMREAIQELVTQDRLDMANALSEASLACHPESEDVLAISSLVSMVRQDWVQAIELLTRLMQVQGDEVTPFTHLMLVRALRSNLEPALALAAAEAGLRQHPRHADLLAERVSLIETSSNAAPSVAAD